MLEICTFYSLLKSEEVYIVPPEVVRDEGGELCTLVSGLLTY